MKINKKHFLFEIKMALFNSFKLINKNSLKKF